MTSTDPHAHAHGVDDETHNADVAHEDVDIDVGAVLKFGAGLFVTVVVCALIVGGIFKLFVSQAAARDPQISPLARPAGQLPTGPRLLTDEPGALAKFRAEETRALDGYGWVDQLGGVTHIPVADAKKLLAERGLPVRADVQDNAAAGTRRQAYGESSGGRNIR